MNYLWQEIIFTIMDVNVPKKKFICTKRDFSKRRGEKIKRVWMTEELFCTMDE